VLYKCFSKGKATKMTMKNRSRVEILYDIIAAARASARKTHLMYKSNLSFKQLDLYLKFLMRQSLIEERFDIEDGSKRYYVTNKGLQFLGLFENLQSYMGISKLSESETPTFVASPENPETTEKRIVIPQAIF
jgi:predicted transcriptional regulator